MKAKVLVFLLLVMFIFPSCKNITDEILPVGEVEIFLDSISFQDDIATISLKFRELAGVESEVMCLMPKFMKDGSFLECGYFAPCVEIPRYGEISWIQKMPVTGAYKEADILRIIIQLQTENFEGFHVSKDFNIKIGV